MWFYKNEEISNIPDDYIGFVYLITNLTNNRKYIGKKLFLFSKTSFKTVVQKNGKKKKKKIRSKVESDWLEYYGSSVELSKDVELLGKDNFKREILFLCKTKSECSYVEAREQFVHKVLESDEYYNGHIQLRCHKMHIRGKVSF